MAGSRTVRYPKLMVGSVDVADKWTAQDAATAAVAADLATHTNNAAAHALLDDQTTSQANLWSAYKIYTELSGKLESPIAPFVDIPADTLTPAMLDIDNAEVDTYVLSYDLASMSFKWVDRVLVDGSNLAADSITEGMLAINTAAGAGVDNFAICWDDGNSRLDYMEMLLQDLSNITAASITEAMLDVNNAPTDTYALVWNATAGKMEWQDVSAVVGSDTYQVKWDAADTADYLGTKIPELDAWTGKAGQSMVLDSAETALEWLPRLTRITSNLNLYIATTGDDITGTGSAGTPWKSIAKCISYLKDFMTDPGVTVTINVAAGTYVGMALITINAPFLCNVAIVGDGVTTTEYQCTAGFFFMYGGNITIHDMEITGPAGSTCISLIDGAVLAIYNLAISAFNIGIVVSKSSSLYMTGDSVSITSCALYCMQVVNFSAVYCTGNLTVSASAYGIYASEFAHIHASGTITANTCTTYGIYAYNCSIVSANAYSFSGNTANTNFAITTTSNANTIGGFNSIIIDR